MPRYSCYCCEVVYPTLSCFTENRHGLLVCYDSLCDVVMSKIDTLEPIMECPVCFEDKPAIELPTCDHKICLDCCKTIYFGTTSNPRPIHWREIAVTSPEFPLTPRNDEERNDAERNDAERKDSDYFDYANKKQEYQEFVINHYEMSNFEHSYDELVYFRNIAMNKRPDWMNTKTFIDYENKCFKYNLMFTQITSHWEEYNKSKTKGCGNCPVCRAKPC